MTWCGYDHVVVRTFQREDVSKIAELFPFASYFSTAPQPLFKGASVAEDLDIAEVRLVMSCDTRVLTCGCLTRAVSDI